MKSPLVSTNLPKDTIDREQFEEEEDSSEDELDDRDPESPKMKSHPLVKIYGEMESYMSQVPVIGFNSAKYDLNLIKSCIVLELARGLGNLCYKEKQRLYLYRYEHLKVSGHVTIFGSWLLLCRLPQGLPRDGTKGLLSIRMV